MPKIHYAINRGQPLCGQSGEIWISADLDRVTCKKCLTQLILKDNFDMIDDRPIVYMTGMQASIMGLAEVVSQALVKENMVEEAFEMHQMVGKIEYLEEALEVFEQYVKLK